MGEDRNEYRVLVEIPEGKSPLGLSRRIWQNNITEHVKENTLGVHRLD
jgi:hypothetical protein